MASSRKPASAAVSAPGRILAIDYGQKRIGLALSDELQMTAQPLQTLMRTNRRNDLRRLREIARKHEVRRILVGHPLHLDGGESEMAAEAARFARRVEKELGLPVELADERLSSWEAHQMFAETSRKQRRRRVVDEIAAAIILRDYLASARQKEARR